MPSDALALQRCLACLVLDPDSEAFEDDPGSYARARGLGAEDQAAFRRFQDRLLFYRDSVRGALWEPVELYFPLLRILLEDAGAWQACAQAFLATRSVRSPYYRDVAPTFLGWLATSGWGQDRWPFLLQLAHFELVKELVEHVQEPEAPAGLHPEPAPGDRLVLPASTLVLTYAFRVHEATFDQPEPAPGACHLLASRGADGYVQWRTLTQATAALLVRAQGASFTEVMADLGLVDRSETFALLQELRSQGAILGFVDTGYFFPAAVT
jgi:hypothetical protein